VYIHDRNRLHRVSTNGIITTVADSFKLSQSEITPGGMTVDSANNIYVLNRTYGVIKVDPTTGDLSSQVLDIDPITDNNDAQISNLASSDMFLSVNVLKYPSGISIESDKRTYISDTGNNRVLLVDEDGKAYVIRAGNPENLPTISGKTTPLNRPGNTALAQPGRLLVTDTANHRVLVFERWFDVSDPSKTNHKEKKDAPKKTMLQYIQDWNPFKKSK